ncbi:MAG: hypothetical protein ACXAEU_21150 [Candidatus Hodarchaeales archaeon]|jgi:hypothetical protein
MTKDDLLEKLNVICGICHYNCEGLEILEFDQELFEQCLKIMQDDLAAFFDFLRLNSPVDRVVCNVRNFVYYVVTEGKQFKWYYWKEKQLVTITPIAFLKHFKKALARWHLNYPAGLSLKLIEEVLRQKRAEQGLIEERSLKRWLGELPLRDNDTNSRKQIEKTAISHKKEGVRASISSQVIQQPLDHKDFTPAINLAKKLETECPVCGKRLLIKLDDKELNDLLKGGRLVRKAVEHVTKNDSHVVELFIDSQLKIRRKNALKLVKAII